MIVLNLYGTLIRWTLVQFNFINVNLYTHLRDEIVVTIDGFTGCSYGCSGKLLMVYESGDSVPFFVQQIPMGLEFIDLNNDGIHERYSRNFIMWMGYDYETHYITEMDRDLTLISIQNAVPSEGYAEMAGLKNDTILKTTDLNFKYIDDDSISDIVATTEYQIKLDSTSRFYTDTFNLKKLLLQ